MNVRNCRAGSLAAATDHLEEAVRKWEDAAANGGGGGGGMLWHGRGRQLLSSMQLSVALDLAAEAALTAPTDQHAAAAAQQQQQLSGLAGKGLGKAAALERAHNTKAV
eukprot:SAG22_NODE_6003_length_917_cov_1.407090_1_plen_107_part_10